MWDAQKRVDPHVKSLHFKSWPYYCQWLGIFGKGRAMGDQAMDTMDFVNELLRTTDEQERDTADMDPPRAMKKEELGNTSVCKPSVEEGKGKKRKSMDSGLTSYMRTLGDYMKNSDETFNTLATRMGTKYGTKVARSSLKNKLKVSEELVRNTSRMELFLSLPPNEQAEYVLMLLDGSLN
ncbi:hypothetical protein ACS0TY_005155 [Phlomoides rotata]